MPKEAASGLIRTTNAVEGWHFGVTALFQSSLPFLYTFLDEMKLDAANQKLNILIAVGGNNNRGRKIYREQRNHKHSKKLQ